MKFKELCKIPIAPPPDNPPEAVIKFVEKQKWGNETREYIRKINQYTYQAQLVDEMLVITIYHGINFNCRIFIDGEDFCNQKADHDKPSTACLYNLLNWYGGTVITGVGDAGAVIDNYLHKASFWYRYDYQKSVVSTYESIRDDDIRAVARYQQHLREKALKSKYDRIKNSIDQSMLEIRELPQAIYKWINKVAMKTSAYIFYDYTRSGSSRGRCSYCGHEVYVDKPKHNEHGSCPHCKTAVIYISNNRFRNMHRFIDAGEFFYLQTTKDGYCIRHFNVTKTYVPKNNVYNYSTYQHPFQKEAVNIDGEPWRAGISLQENNRMFYENGGRFVDGFKWDNFQNTGDFRWCKGGYDNGWDGWIYPQTLKKICKNDSRLQYIPLDKIVRMQKLNPQRVIKNAIKYPFMEYLYKLGLHNLTIDICRRFDSSYSTRNADEDYINPNGKNIVEILGVDKQDIKQLIRINPNETKLKLYKLCRKMGAVDADVEKAISWTISNIGDICNDRYNAEWVLHYTSIVKIRNYLLKQQSVKNSNTSTDNFKTIFSDWLDYLGECRELQYNLDDSAVMYPKNLYAAHERTTGICKIMQEKDRADKHRKKCRERYEELKHLTFADDDYIVRPVKTANELITEGARQSHCVGGYLERHAQGKLSIFVLRKKSEPNKSFYTIELTNSLEIQQCRGYKNASATLEVNDFLVKWKKHLKAKKAKGEKERVRVTA